jgi:AcrR family transcriptional regulator
MSRPKRTEAEVQWRRERILDASAAVFQRVGFAAATMEEIARESEYSTGALYNYFKGKEEIFVAALEQATARFDGVFAEAVPAGLDFEHRLRWRMARITEVAFATRGLIMVMNGGEGPPSLGAYAPRVQQCEAQAPQLWEALLAEGQSEGCLRVDLAPRMLAEALMGMVKGVLAPMIVAPHPPTLDVLQSATARLIDLFLHGAQHR